MPDDERRMCEDAIRRIYPDETKTARRILEQLLSGPKTPAALTTFMARVKLRGGVEFLRKVLAEVRKSTLPQFYLGPRGFGDKFKIAIPHIAMGESYRLIVEDRQPLEDAGGFWAAHLGNRKPTRIVTGRPEFLRVNGDGMMFRQEMLNGLSGELATLLQKTFPVLADMELKRVQPYIAVTDVQAMLTIYSYFDSWRHQFGHLPPELLASEEDATRDDANLVVLGTPLDNPRILELESEALGAEWPGRGSLFIGRDGVSLSKTMPNGEYRVWVHRRLVGTHFETLVNAPTSEVLAPICDFLTSDERMSEVIAELGSGRTWMGFPDDFQIQLRVRISSDGKRLKKTRIQQYLHGAGLSIARPDDRDIGRPVKDYGTEADWGYGPDASIESTS